jgi:hypothetical protein
MEEVELLGQVLLRLTHQPLELQVGEDRAGQAGEELWPKYVGKSDEIGVKPPLRPCPRSCGPSRADAGPSRPPTRRWT